MRAFRAAAIVLEPLMRLTEYPPSCASSLWFCVVGCELRLQQQGCAARHRLGEDWSKTVACRVSPVWSRGVLRHVLGICLARASKKTVHQIKYGAALCEVCSLVCLFEGAVPPEAFNTHKVSVTSLSHGRGLPKHPHLAIKVCVLAGRARRLVRVVSRDIEVDVAAVSAAIDTHSWFSVGCRGDVHDADRCGRQLLFWRAASRHHRSRLLAPPDAACESLGSQVRWLWDQRAACVSPTVFADKLHLAAAGVSCLGAGRDEPLVECTLRMMEDGSQRRLTPFLRRQRRSIVAHGQVGLKCFAS